METKEKVRDELQKYGMEMYETGYNDGVKSVCEVLRHSVESMTTYIKPEELMKKDFISLLDKLIATRLIIKSEDQ